MYFETVACDTVRPSFNSSPWVLGAPQRGLAQLIRRISSRPSVRIMGLPMSVSRGRGNRTPFWSSVTKRVQVVNEREQIRHSERTGLTARKGGMPVRLQGHERRRIRLQKADEDFGEDPAANRAKPLTGIGDLGFLENVVPEGAFLMEAVCPCHL